MYLADVVKGATLRGPSLRRVAVGNVVALGMVSLWTDISSEMVTAVLPAYLVLTLHLSFAQYGFLDGLYTGATAFTRLSAATSPTGSGSASWSPPLVTLSLPWPRSGC